MHDTYLFLAVLAVYGVGIFLGAWYVIPESKRQLWRQLASTNRLVLHSRIRQIQHHCAMKLARFTGWTGSLGAQSRATLSLYRSHVVLTLILLGLPILVVWFLSPQHRLDGYEDLAKNADPVVAALLVGEQLVPPPRLPPEIFVTREVEAIRQELGNASREWMVLDTDFRQRLLTVYQLMAKHGYQMALLEGYRSPERQIFLAKLGAHVTNVGAFQSYHQYGLAADSAFYRNGKVVISEKDPWAMEGYRLYGKYAESVGLTWGGRWKMMDLGHVELRKPGVLGKK